MFDYHVTENSYELIEVDAYILYNAKGVITFKLDFTTIESLINCHLYCVEAWVNYTGRESESMEIHKKFAKDINDFVYKTDTTELEEVLDGEYELLSGKSNEVKVNIMKLFQSLPSPYPAEEPNELLLKWPHLI
jgi:hypothetical protein